MKIQFTCSTFLIRVDFSNNKINLETLVLLNFHQTKKTNWIGLTRIGVEVVWLELVFLSRNKMILAEAVRFDK